MRRSLAVALALFIVVAACGDDGGTDRSLDRASSTTTSPDAASSTSTTEASTTSTIAGFVPDRVDWRGCGSGFECATLDVPVDYSNPGGEHLTIAATRRPARGDRVGALFVNPGGPGGSAIDFVRGGASAFSSLFPGFDIVGIDPRGVGESSRLDCGMSALQLYSPDPTIEDRGDRDRLLSVSRDYIAGCRADAGSRLAFYGSREVARDMDAFRAAMGDAKLSYLGYSYGTAIGQVYAQLFPHRVRAMVLDGVLETGPTGVALAVDQAKGFERALRSFASDCVHNGCALGSNPIATIEQLMRRAEGGIPAPSADRGLGPDEATLALAQSLYSQTFWDDLESGVDRALEGDGSQMVDLANNYLGIASFDVYFAVNCLDAKWPTDPDTLLAAAKDALEVAPHFGESIVTDYVRCSMWPVPAKPIPAITAPGSPPIVVVSTTNDPATPYEAGVAVAKRLANGVLLTYEGEGHGVVAQGVGCIDSAVARYIVELRPPADGTRC